MTLMITESPIGFAKQYNILGKTYIKARYPIFGCLLCKYLILTALNVNLCILEAGNIILLHQCWHACC